jgi:hypothetical protein
LPKPELRTSISNLEEQLKQLIVRVEHSEAEIRQVWRNRLERTLKCMRDANYTSLLTNIATQTDEFQEHDSNISEQLILRPREDHSFHDDEVQLHSPIPSITSGISKAKRTQKITQKPGQGKLDAKNPTLMVPYEGKYQELAKSTLSLVEHSVIPPEKPFTRPITPNLGKTIPVKSRPAVSLLKSTKHLGESLVGEIMQQEGIISRSVSPATPSIRIEVSKDLDQPAKRECETKLHCNGERAVRPVSTKANQLSLTADESSKLRHLVTAKYFSQRKRSDVSNVRTSQPKSHLGNSTEVKEIWDSSWISAEPETVKSNFLKVNKLAVRIQVPRSIETSMPKNSKMELKRITSFDLVGNSKYQPTNPFSTKRNSEEVGMRNNRQSYEVSKTTHIKASESQGFIQKYKNSWKDDNLFNPALDFLYDFTRTGQSQTPTNSQVKILRLNLEEGFLQDQLRVNEVVAIIRRMIEAKKPISGIMAPQFLEQPKRSSLNRSAIMDGMKTLLKYAELCWLSNKEVLALISPIRYLPDSLLMERLHDENRQLRNYYDMHHELFDAYGERINRKMKGYAACQKHSDVLLPNPKMYSLLTSQETRDLHEMNNLILGLCSELRSKSLPIPTFRGFSIEELIEIDIWEARLLSAIPKRSLGSRGVSREGGSSQEQPMRVDWRDSHNSSTPSGQ